MDSVASGMLKKDNDTFLQYFKSKVNFQAFLDNVFEQ